MCVDFVISFCLCYFDAIKELLLLPITLQPLVREAKPKVYCSSMNSGRSGVANQFWIPPPRAVTLLSGCTRREGGYIWASAQFVLDTGWVQFAGICISRWFWFCPVLNSELTLGHPWKCIGYFEYGDTGILDQSKNIDHSIIYLQ